jgi:hypothetical protein
MTDEYLKHYNDGFIPGPIETEEEFLRRVDRVKEIIENPSDSITEKSLKNLKFKPFKGCALLFTSKKYSPLFASQTLILEMDDETLFPLIKSPSKLSSYFISAKEILDHELVHARRSLFEEPKFEEILAYRSSSSRTRRFLGPMIVSNLEIVGFLLCSLLAVWTLIPLLSFTTTLLVRQILRQRTLKKAIMRLKEMTPHIEKVLQSMTDEEITHLSKNQLSKINFSLFRWQFLQKLFIVN